MKINLTTHPLKSIVDMSKEHNVPIKIVPDLNNAYYVREQKLPRIVEEVASNPKFKTLRAIASLSKKPGGGVVIGRPILNTTVLAHEIGHHKDKSLISDIAPKVENSWWKYGVPVIGTIGAMIAGELDPEHAPHYAVGNVAIQALSTAPTLYSEWKASDIAKEIYPEADKELLSSMFNTYLRNAATRVALPTIGHLGHILGRKL